ncbi:MAG: hypothetical protein ABID61_02920 [Candidatus Micrarchaeota archaeon]
MVEWRKYLLLLLLLPTIFASSISPLGKDDIMLMVPLTVMIIIALLAITRMISNAISNPKLDAWVKTEIRELVAALIIISALTGATLAATGLGKVLTNENDAVAAAIDIIDTKWIDKFDDAFKTTIVAAGKIKSAATYSPSMSIPLWFVSLSYTTNPLAGAMLLLTPLTMSVQALTNAIFLSEGMRLLLSYSAVITPQILLPGAFIVRLIPFTRKLGNTLIALAIALHVFLPFSIILVDRLNDTIDRPNPTMDTSMLDGGAEAMTYAALLCKLKPARVLLGLGDYPFALIVCSPLLFIPGGQAAFPGCVLLVQNVVYPIIQLVMQISFTVTNLAWEGLVSGLNYEEGAFDQVMPFLREVSNLVFLTYLNLILIATITISGARSLSGALGGEIYMFGVQRLV